MAHGQFKKILEDVEALSLQEQRRLRAWPDKVCAPESASMTEEEFAHQLRVAGLLSEVKPPITDFTPYQHRQPIETMGKPLSEVIIEERR
ncbi:MAG TPA: hypothetical protein VIH59_12310 [Candidatus Tectomicrobia bacterium]|jgi:hypothetical protein